MKKILCFMLAAAMTLGLAACGSPAPGMPKPVLEPHTGTLPDGTRVTAGQVPDDVPEPEPGMPDDGGGSEPAVSGGPSGTDEAPSWFEDELQEYLSVNCNWSGRSYMVSPASFRAALCLAIEGAEGDTKAGLLKAARFDDEADMQAWFARLLDCRSGFYKDAEWLKQESEEWGDGSDPGLAFDIANAVWDNSDRPGGFLPAYIDTVFEKYGADARSSDSENITADVNAWCDEKTHGMIRKVSDDLSQNASVLANALYVKSGWKAEFSEYYTEPGEFIRADGSITTMDFMRQTEDFRYYKDPAGREYAAFALYGDIWLTVCLDTDTRPMDLFGAMYGSEYRQLDVKMPKLDLETSLDRSELTGYLDHAGAGMALSDGTADFSAMTDSGAGWHIDDVVQVTRLKTDEKGMEAAAVTAIMMADNAAFMEPDPIAFYMDRPFSFLITSGLYGPDSGAEILFFGQYVG